VINLTAHKYFWPLDRGRRGLEWTIGLSGKYWSITIRTALSEITAILISNQYPDDWLT